MESSDILLGEVCLWLPSVTPDAPAQPANEKLSRALARPHGEQPRDIECLGQGAVGRAGRRHDGPALLQAERARLRRIALAVRRLLFDGRFREF